MDDKAKEGRQPAATLMNRAVFDAAPVGLAVFTADGETVRDANPVLCDLLGYEAGAMSGMSVTDLLMGRATSVSAGIARWKSAAGDGVAVRLRLSNENDGDSDLVAVVEAVDPDEIVRAEENRDALIAAGLGEWRWDVADGYVTLSRRAGQILGYRPGRSVTWSAIRRRAAPRETDRVRAVVTDAILRRKSYSFEAPFQRGRDNAGIIIAVKGEPVFGPDGSLVALVGVVQDITKRIAVHRTLTDREQRLRVAASLASLGIFEWHLFDDRSTWENERMFEIFGRSALDGTIGKAEFLSQILHPDDRENFRLAISQALREDRILLATGRIRRAADGAWRVIEMAGRFERESPGALPRRLIGVVADVTERRHAQERQSLLIRELHHRVKNTLATVQAIVGSTARNARSIEDFYEDFVGRIKSLSHTHSVLTEDTWQTASLRDLLVNELRPYAQSDEDEALEERISLEGPGVDLPSDIAVPIGMAIHELTTNAAKYGALSNRCGRIAVQWAVLPGGEAGILRLEWRESDGPPVTAPSHQGFGSRLLQRVLSTQVQADVRSVYAPEGFRLVMTAPLPGRNAALNPLV